VFLRARWCIPAVFTETTAPPRPYHRRRTARVISPAAPCGAGLLRETTFAQRLCAPRTTAPSVSAGVSALRRRAAGLAMGATHEKADPVCTQPTCGRGIAELPGRERVAHRGKNWPP